MKNNQDLNTHKKNEPLIRERDLRKLSLLAEVACDYYERGLNQEEIAERLCLSRTRVSRLLKEALEKNVVNITINYTFERHYELEERLKSRFPLKEVRILNRRNRIPNNIHSDVGMLAARYFNEIIEEDMMIGTAWGSSLFHMVQSLNRPINFVEVVQLAGSIPYERPGTTPQGIVASLADLLGAQASFLNLPLFIEDDYARNYLKNDSNNARVLRKAAFVDIALTSISALDGIQEKQFWKEYLSKEMLDEIERKGAVGTIFAQFFDKDGEIIDCKWNRSCVTISFDDLKNLSEVILVASSISKAPAIFSAIKGELFTTLITDGTTASEILRLNELD